jgi:hypothetical protein
LPDLQPNSPAIRQKYGEKCAAAVDLQPTTSNPDRLLDKKRKNESSTATGLIQYGLCPILKFICNSVSILIQTDSLNCKNSATYQDNQGSEWPAPLSLCALRGKNHANIMAFARAL